MKEKKVVEFSKDKDLAKELEKFTKEGWTVISGEPIEKIYVEIIGRRFTLEREK